MDITFVIIIILVAPYVGAWIETPLDLEIKKMISSHPMWVRGLKRERGLVVFRSRPVAPYVGAWIET